MRELNPVEEKIAKELGDDGRKPLVQFFDHAVPDAALTEESGRPRFRSVVYIRKVPSNPTLVVRDVFDRAMTEEDKHEWPEEWARYKERRQAVDNLDPIITAIPGIGVAQKKELNALNIYRCSEFVNYSSPLDGLEDLRGIARKIMEISHEVRKEREAVRDGSSGQVHNPAQVLGGRAEKGTRAYATAESGNHPRQEQGKEGSGKETGLTYTFTQQWA